MAFTEETVYNSDRHVAIIILFARSDTHAIEEVTFLFTHLCTKSNTVLVVQFSGQSPCKQCLKPSSYTEYMTRISKILSNLWPRLDNSLED